MLHLFIGKGGVGKTTVSAATAVALAESGRRVLVVSSDQAHSLGDVFAVAEAAVPTAVAPGVEVMHLDARELVQQRWRAAAHLATFAGGADEEAPEPFALEPEELVSVPGVEELITLVEVVKLCESGNWDEVVMDCAPTAEALRLLTLPGAVLSYIERVWPRHRRLTSSLGTRGRGMIVVGMLEGLVHTVQNLRDTLADPQRTTVRLVLSPERVVLAEAKRTITALALLGVRPHTVIANRVMVPYDRADTLDTPLRQQSGSLQEVTTGGTLAERWYRSRWAEQRAVLDELEGMLGDIPLRSVEYMAVEPVGVQALADLARHIYEGGVNDPPVTDEWVRSEMELESGSGLDSTYVFRLNLPLVDPTTISLGRVEDDLLVGAAGVSTRITLPSVLRRCVVSGAEFAADQLQVRFVPNPAAWPR